ncbi:hypothetical protein BDN70DRAFT_695079 [Pholiota conissans]|uniref:Uncharacterized protein n=1 Tax=Pholiota conissans TaxID=109636 RepID=A0A9P6CTG7_9AGAR|nr:hypothetical protein BDN70DRAFT_695079 [Pholiota conissans]
MRDRLFGRDIEFNDSNFFLPYFAGRNRLQTLHYQRRCIVLLSLYLHLFTKTYFGNIVKVTFTRKLIWSPRLFQYEHLTINKISVERRKQNIIHIPGLFLTLSQTHRKTSSTK